MVYSKVNSSVMSESKAGRKNTIRKHNSPSPHLLSGSACSNRSEADNEIPPTLRKQ